MVDVLTRLRVEHRNIERLLDVLEHQLTIFDRGEQPDYDVLSAAADYFTRFPDSHHHPKEDLVFRKLAEKDPGAAASIGDLACEHDKLSELARHFQEAVSNVMEDVEVSRRAFDTVLRHFISEQRRHMKMEEENFFPSAVEALTPADWADLLAEVEDEEDPLFGTEASREFESLRRNILSWEEEDEVEER